MTFHRALILLMSLTTGCGYVTHGSTQRVFVDTMPSGAKIAIDAKGQSAILFPSEWSVRYFEQKNPTIPLSDTPVRSGQPVK